MEFTPLQDFQWSTEYYHHDNSFTMIDFLDNHLPNNFILKEMIDSCAEIKDTSTGLLYELHAKGNGDSYNHIVTSILIS